MAADTTTIKVTTATRDRLMALAAADFEGASLERVIVQLMDDHYKAGVVADWDDLRDGDPDAFAAILADNEAWDRLAPNLHETEGPYRSDDPVWLEAGGQPLTETKDAA